MQRTRDRLLRFGITLMVGLGVACGSSGEESPGEPGGYSGEGAFIALARDLNGYTEWEHTTWTEEAEETPLHERGERTVYLNQRPPSGSTGFPVGTIIVKVMPHVEEGGEQIFAMVKRGGDYNLSGARNWEWFELSVTPRSGVAILWRGHGPPAGHRYSQSDQTCNQCHQRGEANDFVLAPSLLLSNF